MSLFAAPNLLELVAMLKLCKSAGRAGALALLVLALGLAFGCAPKERYDYQAVVARAGAVRPPEKAAPHRAEPDLAGPLTLRRAIGIALKGNPDRAAALARIRQSEAMLDRAMAPFWPALSLNAAYQRGDAPSGYLFSAIDQRSLSPTTWFNYPGTFQNYEMGLSARWNLFRGGGDVLAREMARTGLEMSRLNRASVTNALLASVTKAFYNCLAARRFEEIAEQSRQTVAEELRVMEVRRRAGGVLQSDVLSLKVRLARAKEDKVRAEKNLALARAALANLLGASVDAEPEPVDGGKPKLELPPDYAAGLDTAVLLRPELAMARKQVVRAAMGLDAARAEFWPRLDAQGRVYLDAKTPSDFETDKANWTAGLMLNWDVFTGLSTVAGQRAAHARLREMLATDRKALLGVQLEVKSAYLDLNEARARVEVTAASVAQAALSLRLVRRQYLGGSATVTRYLQAELDLSRARTRAVAARFDVEKAKADVARALGLWARHAQKEEGER